MTERSLRIFMDGFIVGSLMGFVFVFIHSQAVKFIAKKDSEEMFEVNQKRALMLHLPYDRAFDLCKESLKRVGKIKTMTVDASHGKIEAITKRTYASWGEGIIYKIQEVGDKFTQIEISSEPLWSTAMVDWGKNLSNVEKISQFLVENDAQININAIHSKLSDLSETAFNPAEKIPDSLNQDRRNV